MVAARALVTTQAGLLRVLDSTNGTIVTSIDAGIGPLAPQGLILKESSCMVDKSGGRGSGYSCIICSTTGIMTELEICKGDSDYCSVVGSVRMQKEVFSGLASIGSILAFGSRDDSVHCIRFG